MDKTIGVVLFTILPTVVVGVGSEESLQLDVEVETSVTSAYMSRGQTFCDGWMNDQGVYLGNIRYGETYIPVTAGYWGIMHLEPTPEEDYSAGKWAEVDYWLGLDIGPYLHDRFLLAPNFMVCGLPEENRYDAMSAVNLDIGYVCWLNPRLHLRNRVLKAHAGKWEIAFSCSHRWNLPSDFWTSIRGTCWAVDYRNVDAVTPSSGFTSLITRGTLGWKMFYVALDVVAPLDPAALPHRRGQYYRPLVLTFGVNHVF